MIGAIVGLGAIASGFKLGGDLAEGKIKTTSGVVKRTLNYTSLLSIVLGTWVFVVSCAKLIFPNTFLWDELE